MAQRHRVMVEDAPMKMAGLIVCCVETKCHEALRRPFVIHAEHNDGNLMSGMKRDKTKKSTVDHEAHPGQTEQHRGWAGHG